MAGDNIKQEINKLIKFVETQLSELNAQIKTNENMIEISSIVKKLVKIFKSKFKFVNISEYTQEKYDELKEYLSEKEFTFNKNKKVVLSTICLAGGVFSFIFAFNGDFFKIDVKAQNSIESVEIAEATSISETKSSEFKFPTLSPNGQNFATDAKEIEEKLNSNDIYNDGEKVVYLTFDDGPTKYTKDILDILKKYNIRGTFFTNCSSIDNGKPELKKVLKESYVYGNSIGNHTYSHDYSTLYPNKSLDLEAFKKDLEKNEEVLKSAIGEDFETNIVRCPGGSMSWNKMEPLEEYFDESNIASIDWNSLTGDSSSKNKDVDTMINNAIETSQNKNLVVLLMHETNKLTPEYLDDIIRYYHNNGYVFKTLA